MEILWLSWTVQIFKVLNVAWLKSCQQKWVKMVTMFSAYLPLDTALYVWDQYLLGLDTPGFNEEFIPSVTAVYLMLLADKLHSCDSVSSVSPLV